ncbi:hypothetical protein CJ014_10160 [Pleomorphomonas carboxyditropha]|uniref:Uncharacterized protein n=1 Tax=Pleomorphomonas carboxyditropha TaxID=2023338 RepID=A0A2G9WY66_9HYPH|nr:hypothetical protein CJ014_10160 [Pleomorphomonas carboxyditropha]
MHPIEFGLEVRGGAELDEMGFPVCRVRAVRSDFVDRPQCRGPLTVSDNGDDAVKAAGFDTAVPLKQILGGFGHRLHGSFGRLVQGGTEGGTQGLQGSARLGTTGDT